MLSAPGRVGTIPPEAFEIHPGTFIKLHTLFFQQAALIFRTRAGTDPTLRVDDPLPGHIFRAGCHGSTHPARPEGVVTALGHVTRRGNHFGDLPVGTHPAGRHLSDDLPDQVVEDKSVGRRCKWAHNFTITRSTSSSLPSHRRRSGRVGEV